MGPLKTSWKARAERTPHPISLLFLRGKLKNGVDEPYPSSSSWTWIQNLTKCGVKGHNLWCITFEWELEFEHTGTQGLLR